MRTSCFDCCRKHIADAAIYAIEIPNYDDAEHVDGLVGSLSHAEAQVAKESLQFSTKLRDIRLAVMAAGYDAELLIGILSKINLYDLLEELEEIKSLVSNGEGNDDRDNRDEVTSVPGVQ